jgi:hypothetical protein
MWFRLTDFVWAILPLTNMQCYPASIPRARCGDPVMPSPLALHRYFFGPRWSQRVSASPSQGTRSWPGRGYKVARLSILFLKSIFVFPIDQAGPAV